MKSSRRRRSHFEASPAAGGSAPTRTIGLFVHNGYQVIVSAPVATGAGPTAPKTSALLYRTR